MITVPIAIGSMVSSVVESGRYGADYEPPARRGGLFAERRRNGVRHLFGHDAHHVQPAVGAHYPHWGVRDPGHCRENSFRPKSRRPPKSWPLRCAWPRSWPCRRVLDSPLWQGPILSLLYASRPEEVLIAAPTLTLLGFAVTFVCLDSITNAILQAIGRERVPVVTMLIGGAVKIATTYVLVGIPGLNIMGAPFSTLLCYSTIIVLNFSVLHKEIGSIPSAISLFGKPLVCSLIACGGARLLYQGILGALGNAISTVLASDLPCWSTVVWCFIPNPAPCRRGAASKGRKTCKTT